VTKVLGGGGRGGRLQQRATRVSLWQDVILPSHYGFFAVVTRCATSQFDRELSDISSHHIMFWKQNFHNINSIKSFLIFPAGSLFSRFLRIATVIRTRAFWYFQPSHYVLKTKSQFERELFDYIPPASSFLFLVAVLKTFATWIRVSILIQWVLFFLQLLQKKLRHEFERAFWYNSFSRQFCFCSFQWDAVESEFGEQTIHLISMLFAFRKRWKELLQVRLRDLLFQVFFLLSHWISPTKFISFLVAVLKTFVTWIRASFLI
jgi:hypothetical protein